MLRKNGESSTNSSVRVSAVGAHLLAAEPVLEGERQEMADVDDLGRLALDDRRAEHARACRSPTSMSSRSSTMSTISSTTRPIERPSSENTSSGCAPSRAHAHLVVDADQRHELAAILHQLAAVGELDLLAVDLLEPGDERQRHRLGLRASRRGTPAATIGLLDLPRSASRLGRRRLRASRPSRPPARCRSGR